ncbi:WHG domain-containing protein [Burkholderia sp. BE17]|uniref:WHG domain-containing protein n=1 Tax=Burkholderia sp. BE17 TaxID=2656644 RepID=UPI001D101B33|nr:WHG domain-containing protein [Burkholderia sp. BE17]
MEENREYMDAAYASDGDVETKLRCVAAAYARFAKERPHQFRILVEPPNEPEALTRIAALIRQQNAKLAALIRRGIDEGWVDADVEPEHASTALWAMMNGVISLMWRPDNLRLDVDHIDDLLGTAWTSTSFMEEIHSSQAASLQAFVVRAFRSTAGAKIVQVICTSPGRVITPDCSRTPAK